ncbi:MAG: hemolysin III family protein [Ignavibacteriota bacterium]
MKLQKYLREPMNGFTHFIGVVLSVIGTILLINISIHPFKPTHFISLTIFGLGLILLYTTSTLYHWLKLSEEGTKKLRRVDHIMIFINIAASYTPTGVIALSGSLGLGLLIAVWSVAIAGIVIKIFWMNAPRWLSTSIYLLMGWLAVFVIVPLFNVLPMAALLWLFAGGLFFTIGAVIYARKKPDPYPGILGFHEIFHLFVLLGSFSHFIMIYKYIAVMD